MNVISEDEISVIVDSKPMEQIIEIPENEEFRKIDKSYIEKKPRSESEKSNSNSDFSCSSEANSSTTALRKGNGIERKKIWEWITMGFTWFVPDRAIRGCNDKFAWREKMTIIFIVFWIYCGILALFVVYPLFGCPKSTSPLIDLLQGRPFKSSSDRPLICAIIDYSTLAYTAIGGLVIVLSIIAATSSRYANKDCIEGEKPIILFMPVFNESVDTLRKTIYSLIDSTYDKHKKILFIVIDSNGKHDRGQSTCEVLLNDVLLHSRRRRIHRQNKETSYEYISATHEGTTVNTASVFHGFFNTTPYVVVVKTGTGSKLEQMTNSHPGNRGKRDSQLIALKFLRYVNYKSDPCSLYVHLEQVFEKLLAPSASALYPATAKSIEYILVADCDTKVDPKGVSYLQSYLEQNPRCVGVCGETAVENGMSSFISSGQVFEYWLTHTLLKAFESFYGNVLVLSGCFTMYRLKNSDGTAALLDHRILQDYTGSFDKTLHEHNLMTIGEDRYLSTLLLRHLPHMDTKYIAKAKCTTTVPDTLSVLLCQRRRWTNSLIHCHLNLLANFPKFSIFTQVSTFFIILIELWMVFMMPITLPVGFAVAAWGFIQFLGSWTVMGATLVIFFLPCLVPVICGNFLMLMWWIPFLLNTPTLSILVPIWSMWRMDDFAWGKTR